MKYFTVFAIPSMLAAANPLVRRQDTQLADEALTLRANFCIDSNKPECKGVVEKCEAEEKFIEDCIQQEHPTCIEDESSPCSMAVVQCLADFGKEEEAFKDCILDKVIIGPATVDDTDDEQAAPSGSEPADAACTMASDEYQRAWVNEHCGGATDAGESNDVASSNESPACKEAQDTFDKAWTANNCEAALKAAIGTSEGEADSQGHE